MTNRDLARKHLDRRLSPLRPAEKLARPPRGWVRAIREAVGMTTEQLARRMGLSQPRIIAIEKGEQSDAVTLSTLRKAAEALECTLVYALVPNQPLDAIVRKRSELIAAEQSTRVDRTMRLENQGVEPADLLLERERLANELLRGNLHRLWENP